MKKALVTGGSGFIGSFLCKELLNNGYNVTVLDHQEPAVPQVNFIKGDILQVQLLTDAIKNSDVVFHLAGILGTDYLCKYVREAVEVNIIGSINVFEAGRTAHVKVINTGLIPEWDNPYMITKKAVMRLGRMYHREFGADITTLEVTHVYGPGQRVEPYHKAIPTFIMRALKNEVLDIYGSGNKYMDCFYVEDLATVIRLSADSNVVSGKVLQIGSGEGLTVKELALKIVSLTNSKSSLYSRKMRPGEPDEDNSLENTNMESYQKLLNWKPMTKLDDGLLKTIEWYLKHSGSVFEDSYRS
jgi:UDP-glucose 4-epimerase